MTKKRKGLLNRKIGKGMKKGGKTYKVLSKFSNFWKTK
jgi:hypothetical protein